MADGVDVFASAVGKKDSEFHVVVRLFPHRSIRCLLPLGSILRMNALQSLWQSRYAIFRSKAVDAIPFIGQVQRVSARNLPNPAPGMRQPLCFCQVTLAPPQ